RQSRRSGSTAPTAAGPFRRRPWETVLPFLCRERFAVGDRGLIDAVYETTRPVPWTMHADIQGRKRIQAVTATTSHTSTGKTATGREGGQTEVRPITQRIAEEIGGGEGQVRVAVDLLDGGATVPFIARYRREATCALDDNQLRALEERLRYLREQDEWRAAILETIGSQGKLTDELRARIVAADSKARLEDIYLPYKPKRRTKAQIAREAGLEPLADLLLDDPSHDPQTA